MHKQPFTGGFWEADFPILVACAITFSIYAAGIGAILYGVWKLGMWLFA